MADQKTEVNPFSYEKLKQLKKPSEIIKSPDERYNCSIMVTNKDFIGVGATFENTSSVTEDGSTLFNFAFPANSTFNDTDGDPLNYKAQLSDGSTLPGWLHFDASQPNQLLFSGIAPDKENLAISLMQQTP